MIVIGYDGSPTSQEAVRQAAALLKAAGPAIIVTVWEPGIGLAMAEMPAGLDVPATPVNVESAMEIDDANEQRAHRVAQEGVALAGSLGLEAQPEVVPDEANVPDTLIEVAQRHSAQAIAIGSRGLGGFRARLLGSVSQKLVQHADRPVLVVHAQAQPGRHGK